VRVEGEIVFCEFFGGLGVGGVVQQDGAENGPLGIHVGRQAGVESQIGDGGHDFECRPDGCEKPLVNCRGEMWESGLAPAQMGRPFGVKPKGLQ